ncbi:DMT family transporter [Enterovirga rhinocerotis]|nr:DMT family transporter [Enterovirga rhinocerotis]
MNANDHSRETPRPAHNGRRTFLVAAWMTGTLLSFCVSAISVRALSRTLGIFEFLSLRSLIGVGLVVAIAMYLPGGLRRLTIRRPRLQLVRNSIHWVGQAAWAYGVTLLPLAMVFSLEFTAPIWLAVLAVPFLGERLTTARIGAVVLGIAGILIVLRPGFVPLGLPSIAVLFSAFAFAITAICTKRLTATEGTFAILFWMNVIQLPLNLALSSPDMIFRIEPGQWLAVIGIGVSGVSSHLCLIQAYRHGDATAVVPFDFLRVPLIALVGWQFYGEALDVYVFLGAIVVIAGITWMLISETRRPYRPPGGTSGSP